MTQHYKIAIAGVNGRMGQLLAIEAWENEKTQLHAGFDRANSDVIGKKIGDIVTSIPQCDVVIGDDYLTAIADADILIDFTLPELVEHHAKACAGANCAYVLGTTGLNNTQEHALTLASRHIPIIYSANMSLGVNLLMALCQQTAKALDEDYDIEIFEAHHRHKIDAPSGTALALGKAAAAGRGCKHDDMRNPPYDGRTGARENGKLGYAVSRGGSVVGDHSVSFYGLGDQITLSHHANNRNIYAKGAIKAALWAKQQSAGIYDMQDVLGIKKDNENE